MFRVTALCFICVFWTNPLTVNGDEDLFTRCVKPTYEYGSYCYDFTLGEELAWNEAWVHCMVNGGRLATISDRRTHDYIANSVIWKSFKKKESWLGAVEHYSPWKWVHTGKSLMMKKGCFSSASKIGAKKLKINIRIPENCVDECQKYQFAFIQGQNCWCGDNVVAEEDDKEKCALNCSGDAQLNCGGEDFFDVYQTKEEEGTYFSWANLTFFDGYNCAAFDKVVNGWVNATCSNSHDYGFTCQDKDRNLFLYGDGITWFGARQKCIEKGQVLATIDSDSLNIEIATKAKSQIRDRFWIGATNREWKWMPSGESMFYSRWADKYPKGKHKSCLMMKMETFSQPCYWLNADCNETRPYICQYYKYKTTTTRSTATTIQTTPKAIITSTLAVTEASPNTPEGSVIVITERQESIRSFPIYIIVIIIIALIVIAVLTSLIVVYVLKKKRSEGTDSTRKSREKSVQFSQNPLYKSSDEAPQTDESLAVNIIGTQEDTASSLYDIPTTLNAGNIQDLQPSRYSVESRDLPGYVSMSYTAPGAKDSKIDNSNMTNAADIYMTADDVHLINDK